MKRRSLQSGRANSISINSRLHRLDLLRFFFLMFFCALGLRLYALQSKDHQRWFQMALNQWTHSLEVQGPRGTILDREGRTLAASVDSVSLGLHPRAIRNSLTKESNQPLNSLVEELSHLTGRSPSEVSKIIKEKKPFVWLGRNLPVSVRDQVARLSIKGLEMFSDFRRFYPQGAVGGVVLGRVGRDGKGQSGVELAFNNALSVPTRRVDVSRDARGRLLNASLRSDVSVRAEGNDIQLTIDSMVQGILEEEFAATYARTKAKHVFGFIMDATTGEILALGQAPTFNPNKADNVSPGDLENQVLQMNFEPGSTMKPLIAAMALEQKRVSTSEQIDCEMGHFDFGSHTVRDVHPIGVVTLRDVLVRSSNIGIAKIGMRFGKENLYEAISSYGFGQRASIGLGGEAKGILRTADSWAAIDSATHSFGQGMAVSALQLGRAYAALANGGLLVQPKLFLNQDNGQDFQPRRILSVPTANKVFEMLYGVTEDEHGTARLGAIPGLRVSGKTGTAHKPFIDHVGYDPDRVVASFVGSVSGAPLGVERTLTAVIVVDEPGVKPRWGGVVAAPTFRNIMERTIAYLLTKTGTAKRV